MMHRWSGWPGAWCLDCGREDPTEIALADGKFDFGNDGNSMNWIGTEEEKQEYNDAFICPEPNSNRYNPYHN